MDAHLTVSCSSVLSLLVLDAPSSRSPPGWLRAASPPLPQLITVAIYLLSSWKGDQMGAVGTLCSGPHIPVYR